MTAVGLMLLLASTATAQEEATATLAEALESAFDRPHDAVVVQDLTALIGLPLDRIGAFAVGEQGLAVIPVQIDERTEAGEYVFQGGEKAETNRSNGVLDARDETVFVGKDAGRRLRDFEAWPEGATRATEVEIVDPRTGGRAYVYLFAFESAAPVSPLDYVSYDRDQELVTSVTYSMRYTPGEDHIFFSDLIVPPSSGGSGEDFCDRLKLRTYVKTKFLLSLSFDEEEWNSEVVGYIDGPVRVIRQVQNTLRFLGIIKVAPTVEVDATYYPAYHHAPARIQQTVDFASIANEAWFKASIDLNEHARGMRYYRPSENVVDPYHVVDGMMTSAERTVDSRDPPWHLVTGPPGTFVWRMRVPEPLEPVTDLFFQDDASTDDDPESTPGAMGEVGIKFDLLALPKGDYRAELFYMFPPNWQPGDEETFLAMIDHPLQTRVTTVQRPLAAAEPEAPAQ